MHSSCRDGEPAIIYGRKGSSPGDAQIITADYSSAIAPDEQQIQFNENVQGRYSNGTITSTKIGPVLRWEQLYTEVKINPADQEDAYFQVLGLDGSGEEFLLFDQVAEGSMDISSIDPNVYPELRIKGLFLDTTNLSVPQLAKWMVSYETPPEGVLLSRNPNPGPVKVEEGSVADFNFTFRNTSKKDFSDSLKVVFSSFNLDTRNTDSTSFYIAPVLAMQEISFSTQLNTVGKVGVNDIDIIVNPGILTEQTFSNNFIHLSSYLEVAADDTNPIVDVTFDGIHIFDGDIVSPSPIIQVDIRDSNPYLILSDTTVADILLTPPCEGCTPSRINFSDPNLNWTASSENEPFSIEYQPQMLENGLYLLEVQARDASGNQAGVVPFEVNFEIINESSVTNFYPYPNPFSTSTRFVFTLTGIEIPDEIKIQILTVSGKVVREITQDELGPLRIGNNLSEYAWDGRDEFGDQLANGPYLYKVTIRINGESVDMRESAGDKAFKKGYGKLYLLR